MAAIPKAAARLLPALPLLASAAAPGRAQQLPYAEMIAEEARAGPRLGYELLEESEAAPSPSPAPAATAEAAEEGSIREVYLDRLEWRAQTGGNAYNWDASATFGRPVHRIWLSTTGDGLTGGGLDYVEVQALYSRPIGGSELNLQAGLRQDFVPRPRRTYVAAGVQGNASDPLYLGAFGFLSHRGEFTGRLFALYDLELVPERLILQPALETEIAAADVPELGIGAGFIYGEAGLRLRYRYRDWFAPYVGVNWERLLGRTARMAREAGDDVETLSFVLGVRSYF